MSGRCADYMVGHFFILHWFADRDVCQGGFDAPLRVQRAGLTVSPALDFSWGELESYGGGCSDGQRHRGWGGASFGGWVWDDGLGVWVTGSVARREPKALAFG